MATTVGQRIADYRRRRGMSQRDLAAAMKRSESWMSQVERGVQPVERLSILQGLAQALGVSVRDLRPEAVPEPPEEPTNPNDLDALRLELSGHPALDLLFGGDALPKAPVDPQILRAEVDALWGLAHESRFPALSEALVELVPRLERASREATGDGVKAVHVERARAYQAVAAAFARQNEPDAAWVAADRAITAAELSGQPLEVVAGHFRLAHAFIRLRRYDQAERVTAAALDTLEPLAQQDNAPPELLSLCGAMHLVHAVISGHESNRATAREHLARAAKLGDRLGEDRNDFDTEFGPTNVRLHMVAVAVDLGDAGEALDIAAHLDASGLSPERQSRLLMDVARAHAQRRHVGEALTALLDAERVAPDYVRSHHLAHDTIADLFAQSARRPPTELADLAQRSGAMP